jgi:hypothetical protein
LAVLGEVLTWLGVAGAAALAWGLYIFGESQPKRSTVKVEENATED